MPPRRAPAAIARPGRGRDLALIHIAAQQLGLRRPDDDSAYRDMLWSVARVRSAADLDAGGRAAVLRHLEGCGWRPTGDRAGKPGAYRKGTPAALIRWLWTQLHQAGKVEVNTDRALRRYVAQHAGVRPAGQVTELAPQHLSKGEAHQVIEQLKAWLGRPER